MTSSGQPEGKDIFPQTGSRKQAAARLRHVLGVPFKSVALKIAERSNSELLDFLGFLIWVSIRLGVLI